MNVIETIKKVKVVPVIAIEDAGLSVDLGNALSEGGINIAEITFRTKCASQAIREMADNCPNMLVGAGTVITVDQVKEAVDSGATFIVSPGLNKNVVEYCQKVNLPIVPGVITPTELQAALELGLDLLKFFPAEAAGGVNFLKSLAAPFPQVSFIPTGGISKENILDYLNLGCVLACGGSWLATKQMISDKKFDEILKLTKEAAELVKS